MENKSFGSASSQSRSHPWFWPSCRNSTKRGCVLRLSRIPRTAVPILRGSRQWTGHGVRGTRSQTTGRSGSGLKSNDRRQYLEPETECLAGYCDRMQRLMFLGGNWYICLLVPRSAFVGENTASTPAFVLVHPGGGIFLAATHTVTIQRRGRNTLAMQERPRHEGKKKEEA